VDKRFQQPPEPSRAHGDRRGRVTSRLLSSEDGSAIRVMRPRRESHLDFKVDILEFEGQLDVDLFLD